MPYSLGLKLPYGLCRVYQYYLEENITAVDISLTDAELAEINAVFPVDAAAGSRYPEEMMRLADQ